jgi:group I intron endonuclease
VKRTCGVYVIICRANDRAYVGSSIDVEHRIRSHALQLVGGRHANKHLQRAWDKHGASVFVFGILATCKAEERIALEQQYIDAAFRTGKPFNGNRSASTYTPMSSNREREVAALISDVTAEQWATNSDRSIGDLIGLHRATIQAHRPPAIPSPGTTREYLSAMTKAGLRRSPVAKRRLRNKMSAEERARQRRASYEASRERTRAKRWERIKLNPIITCSECSAQFVVLRLGKATSFCSDACYWRDEAKRKAAQRAAYKRRRRAETGRNDYWSAHV